MTFAPWDSIYGLCQLALLWPLTQKGSRIFTLDKLPKASRLWVSLWVGERRRMRDKEREDMRETLGICSSAHIHTHIQYSIYTSFDTCNSNFTTDLACLTISWLREMPSFISLAKGRNCRLFYPRSTLVLHTTPNLPRAGVIHLVVLLKSVFSQSVLHVCATSLYHERYWIAYSFLVFFYLINLSKFCSWSVCACVCAWLTGVPLPFPQSSLIVLQCFEIMI